MVKLLQPGTTSTSTVSHGPAAVSAVIPLLFGRVFLAVFVWPPLCYDFQTPPEISMRHPADSSTDYRPLSRTCSHAWKAAEPGLGLAPGRGPATRREVSLTDFSIQKPYTRNTVRKGMASAGGRHRNPEAPQEAGGRHPNSLLNASLSRAVRLICARTPPRGIASRTGKAHPPGRVWHTT